MIEVKNRQDELSSQSCQILICLQIRNTHFAIQVILEIKNSGQWMQAILVRRVKMYILELKISTKIISPKSFLPKIQLSSQQTCRLHLLVQMFKDLRIMPPRPIETRSMNSHVSLCTGLSLSLNCNGVADSNSNAVDINWNKELAVQIDQTRRFIILYLLRVVDSWVKSGLLDIGGGVGGLDIGRLDIAGLNCTWVGWSWVDSGWVDWSWVNHNWLDWGWVDLSWVGWGQWTLTCLSRLVSWVSCMASDLSINLLETISQ